MISERSVLSSQSKPDSNEELEAMGKDSEQVIAQQVHMIRGNYLRPRPSISKSSVCWMITKGQLYPRTAFFRCFSLPATPTFLLPL